VIALFRAAAFNPTFFAAGMGTSVSQNTHAFDAENVAGQD
jgi:hypothetical protein